MVLGLLQAYGSSKTYPALLLPSAEGLFRGSGDDELTELVSWAISPDTTEVLPPLILLVFTKCFTGCAQLQAKW